MKHRWLRAALALGLAILVISPASADHDGSSDHPPWAPVGSATIRPGVMASGCTTNFVFYERHEDAEGNVSFDVFIGLAAHCFSLGNNTQTNGCTTPTRPLGSQTGISGASRPATLVYSSWVTMQAVKEQDASTCSANDFAIVELDPLDHAKVNPTLLFYGGPDGLRATATAPQEKVFSYGNSGLRLGISQLSPKRGVSRGTSVSGWTHRVYTVTPGIPGDSGSAFVDETGRAFGVVVTVSVDGSNGVTDLSKALAYLRATTGRDVRLARATEPFDDPLLP